jgi:hopanoid-associated phosphorylase
MESRSFQALVRPREAILVITGMAAEMRLATGPGSIVVGSAGDPDRLRLGLAERGAAHFRAVLSFGLAGGLDPALRPGDVVVATETIADEGRWPADRPLAVRLMERLAAGGLRPVMAAIAGSDLVVANERTKSEIHRASGAAAVDMESHVAAAYAAAAGVPFAALRVVCDPAARSLPPLAAQALRADGGIDFQGVLRSLARQPGQLPALLRLAADARAAFAALRRCRDLLGIGRGFPDFRELLGDVA